MFSRSLSRCFKRKAHDAFHAMTREDRDFGRSFPRLVDVRTSPVTGVLALGVLAYDNPVQIAGLAVPKR
jgi:hypothetical protein